METIRRRAFRILDKVDFSEDVRRIFCLKLGQLRPDITWKRLQDKKLLSEVLFIKYMHTTLSGPTYRVLVYAFAKAYYQQSKNEQLRDYANMLICKYEVRCGKLDVLVQQKEQKLLDYILGCVQLSETESRKFMRQSITLLVLASKMKYDSKTEEMIDCLLDNYEEGRAVL